MNLASKLAYLAGLGLTGPALSRAVKTSAMAQNASFFSLSDLKEAGFEDKDARAISKFEVPFEKQPAFSKVLFKLMDDYSLLSAAGLAGSPPDHYMRVEVINNFAGVLAIAKQRYDNSFEAKSKLENNIITLDKNRNDIRQKHDIFLQHACDFYTRYGQNEEDAYRINALFKNKGYPINSSFANFANFDIRNNNPLLLDFLLFDNNPNIHFL